MIRGVGMWCPAWLLALAVLCAGGSEVRAPCWEHPHCRDLSTEENIMNCIQHCKSDFTNESPIHHGESYLQPPSESEQNEIFAPFSTLTLAPAAEQMGPESRPQHERKRSYFMEHFRWGKPVQKCDQQRPPEKGPVRCS